MKRDPVFGFRPLSGNLLSLLTVLAMDTNTCEPFSSPIGESTFSTLFCSLASGNVSEFSSPIGESTFSTQKSMDLGVMEISFRPLSGNLLSLR